MHQVILSKILSKSSILWTVHKSCPFQIKRVNTKSDLMDRNFNCNHSPVMLGIYASAKNTTWALIFVLLCVYVWYNRTRSSIHIHLAPTFVPKYQCRGIGQMCHKSNFASKWLIMKIFFTFSNQCIKLFSLESSNTISLDVFQLAKWDNHDC